MSQHLYKCERCSKHGVAHYILVKDETMPGGWRNELCCKGCWELDEARKKEVRAAA